MNTLPVVLNHLIPALQAIQKDLAIKGKELYKTGSEERDEHAEPQNQRRRELLTINQASTFLSISTPSLYRLTSQRQIPHYKIGGRVLFSEEKLWDWLEQRSITAQR